LGGASQHESIILRCLFAAANPPKVAPFRQFLLTFLPFALPFAVNGSSHVQPGENFD